MQWCRGLTCNSVKERGAKDGVKRAPSLAEGHCQVLLYTHKEVTRAFLVVASQL